MSADKTRQQNPQQQEPKPPFPEQQQQPPGTEAQLQPKTDHGEESYHDHNRLAGKAAIITGADSGIGRAVALAFAREGADVLIAYWKEDSDAQETARLVSEAGRKAVLVSGDIGDEQHCEQIVQRALDEFGHLDILVNNAAYQMVFESIDKISTEQFERTLRTNVYGMFFLCRTALSKMRSGGAIINTASIEAYEPKPILLPYASTKGFIVTFTKALSRAAIKQGIRVNAVAPGPVWTPLIPASHMHTEKFGESAPIGRPAQPAELAPAYVFLASSEANYVVGEVLGVTGGKFLP